MLWIMGLIADVVRVMVKLGGGLVFLNKGGSFASCFGVIGVLFQGVGAGEGSGIY